MVNKVRISFLSAVPAQIEERIRSKEDEGSNSANKKIEHCLGDDQHIVQLSHFRIRQKHHDDEKIHHEAKQTEKTLKS